MMEYYRKIESCATLDELFSAWKIKNSCQHRIVSRGQTKFLRIDYEKNGFISDGIVNESGWNNGQAPKILFVMKSLSSDIKSVDVDIRSEMRKGTKSRLGITSNGFSYLTIGKWAKGLSLTDKERIEPYYHKFCDVYAWWKSIAVMGLKKENDDETISDPDIIDIYAESDSVEIKKEIEIINPDIIVCCSTYRTLMTYVFGYEPEDGPIYNSDIMKNNWCNMVPVNGKDSLFIDYVEPCWPYLVAYYGLVNIYQQALISNLI